MRLNAENVSKSMLMPTKNLIKNGEKPKTVLITVSPATQMGLELDSNE